MRMFFWLPFRISIYRIRFFFFIKARDIRGWACEYLYSAKLLVPTSDTIGLLIGYSIGIGPSHWHSWLRGKLGFPSHEQLDPPCYVIQTHLWLSALVASVTDSFPQLKDQSSVTAADTKKFVIDNGAAAAVNNGPSYVFFMEEDSNFWSSLYDFRRADGDDE